MKFLLVAVNAKYIHSNPAVYSLRSYAGKELRQYVEIAEYTINQRTEQILADIYGKKPDVIGFSCYIWNRTSVQRVVRDLAKILPRVPIWLGGPEVSFEYEQILEKFPEVTGIMTGEGEETFRELIEAYAEYFERRGICAEHSETAFADKLRETDFQIPGTVTRHGVYPRYSFLSMDSLPFYYNDLSPEEEKQLENRIIYYESSRGCPFRCSYCLSSVEKQVRFRNTETVKKELRFFLDKKVKQVKFIDRTFNCNPNHALEIWRFLLENDNGVTNFHFEAAAELLDGEQLNLLSQMRRGLVQLEIGVQTTNEETLRAIHRFCQLKTLKTTVASVRSFQNIHLHLDLIAGLPYEDLKSFRNSFNEVYEMKPHQLQLGFLKVLAGSEMYERAEEYGIVFQSEPPYEVLYTKWISYEDVRELKKVEEMVELFYNSNQFTHTLPVLKKLFQNAYEMFSSLAEFYERNGFFVNHPARSYRYEVLLQFIEERLKEEYGNVPEELRKLFRELLTFDVYLREKAKSRPVFAGETDAYRQEIAAFYRREENTLGNALDVLKKYAEKGYDSRQTAHMTHMEAFHYPVWDVDLLEKADLEEICIKTYIDGGQLVLFDYLSRDPVTYEALAVPV